MDVKLYLYHKCSTCQSALKYLEKKHLSIDVQDISLHPPSLEELKQMLSYQNDDLKKLFNTSGILYREMQLSQKLHELSTQEALHLLSNNGMLVKRPFLLGTNYGLLGFKIDQWNQVFV